MTCQKDDWEIGDNLGAKRKLFKIVLRLSLSCSVQLTNKRYHVLFIDWRSLGWYCLPCCQSSGSLGGGRRPAFHLCHPGRSTNRLSNTWLFRPTGRDIHESGWRGPSQCDQSALATLGESVRSASAHDAQKAGAQRRPQVPAHPVAQAVWPVCPPSLLRCAWDLAENGSRCPARSHGRDSAEEVVAAGPCTLEQYPPRTLEIWHPRQCSPEPSLLT